MRHAAFSSFMQMLRRVAARHARDEQADAELLARFVRQGDEAAFEVLVHRHGPMVWSVCRRLLTRTEDAEDAFQAAFVVLLRRAGSIRDGSLLGNWLYGVAYRVAVRARARDPACSTGEARDADRAGSDRDRDDHRSSSCLPRMG